MDIVSAGIVPVYNKDGIHEYLLLQHADLYSNGHWDFPKGKVEWGENNQQAAQRELKEEAGLEATIVPGFEYSFSYFFKDYLSKDAMHQTGLFCLAHKTVFFYIGIVIHPQVTLSYEHQNYAWLYYEQAHEKLTHDNAKKLLEEVQLFLAQSNIK